MSESIYVKKPCRNFHWLGEFRLLIFFWSNLPLNIIIPIHPIRFHCVTDQPPTTSYQRFVLNYKFPVLTSLRSMTCLMCIAQKMRQEKRFPIPSMSKVMTCVDQSSAVQNFFVSCLNSIFNLNNPKMKIQRAKSWFKSASFEDLYTPINTNLWLSNKVYSKFRLRPGFWSGRVLLKLSAGTWPHFHFAWRWDRQWTDADRGLNLNTTIVSCFLCFRALGVGPSRESSSSHPC